MNECLSTKSGSLCIILKGYTIFGRNKVIKDKMFCVLLVRKKSETF